MARPGWSAAKVGGPTVWTGRANQGKSTSVRLGQPSVLERLVSRRRAASARGNQTMRPGSATKRLIRGTTVRMRSERRCNAAPGSEREPCASSDKRWVTGARSRAVWFLRYKNQRRRHFLPFLLLVLPGHYGVRDGPALLRIAPRFKNTSGRSAPPVPLASGVDSRGDPCHARGRHRMIHLQLTWTK